MLCLPNVLETPSVELKAEKTFWGAFRSTFQRVEAQILYSHA
jgi:hypothetical protein